MLMDLAATSFLGIIPFLAGFAVSIYFSHYRKTLLIVTGIPAIYFTVNLLVALSRQGLEETLILGIPLGISPVFIMWLTALTAGPFLGLIAGGVWQQRKTSYRVVDSK